MIFALLVALLLPAALMAKTKKIVILHTNDTHSCIMPLGKTLADTTVAGRGGYLRRLEMVRQERRQEPQLLLLDSGDFSQGSPYYSMFQGDVEIGLMNLMHYDAATIGNHEFDFGLDNMARIFRQATFPIVCANYDFTGTPVEGLVKPYVIIRRQGLKIGIFGIATKLDGLVQKRNCEGVTYLDPIATANAVAQKLKQEEKCDLVVCLSHLGWNIGGTDDNALMPATRNIDIVLGAHSHTYFRELQHLPNLDGIPVPNDQNGKSGVFVGKIDVLLKK